jgi:hypothetical protein
VRSSGGGDFFARGSLWLGVGADIVVGLCITLFILKAEMKFVDLLYASSFGLEPFKDDTVYCILADISF